MFLCFGFAVLCVKWLFVIFLILLNRISNIFILNVTNFQTSFTNKFFIFLKSFFLFLCRFSILRSILDSYLISFLFINVLGFLLSCNKRSDFCYLFFKSFITFRPATICIVDYIVIITNSTFKTFYANFYPLNLPRLKSQGSRSITPLS